MSRRKWTDAERALLREQYPDTDTVVLSRTLGRTERAIYQQARLMGLKKTADYLRAHVYTMSPEIGMRTRFKPGQTAHNKGKHYQPGGRSAETRFKPGGLPHNTRTDGATTWRHDGYLWVRTGLKQWKQYHRLVYEQHHGVALDKKDVVRFRDGNHRNFDPENLYLTDRRGNMLDNTIQRYPEEVKKLIRTLTKLKRTIRHATTGTTTTTDPANPADQ